MKIVTLWRAFLIIKKLKTKNFFFIHKFDKNCIKLQKLKFSSITKRKKLINKNLLRKNVVNKFK